ncbi:Gp37-like protein [Nonomuraea recticatena]|uniref:Gp28/Gp37-like domain-containing protein n=1 Tax=Nonomuraea recticatena TaxID=46178 RepID=A0ABP6EHD6_9ACTN
MPKFIIEARGPAYQRIGLVEQYTDFTAIIRYCDVGTWTLEVPANAKEAALLQPGHGIIVRLNGQTEPLFSGPITSQTRKWSADDPGPGSITYSGVTDEWLLWQRITYPVPANDVLNQTADRYVATGIAGSVLVDLVAKNAAAGARPERRYDALDTLASASGSTISTNTRFDVLGQKCQEIALASGLGFRVRQGINDRLRFEVFVPQDRSVEAVFGQQYSNINSYEWKLTAPQADTIIMACQGEGKYRYVVQRDYKADVVELLNSDAGRIVYAGTWTNQVSTIGDYGNEYQRTVVAGSTATLNFTGTGVRWFTRQAQASSAQGGGTVQVLIDGQSQGTVSPTRGDSTVVPRYLGYERGNLPYGQHTITLVHQSGTSAVDYFEILDQRLSNTNWRMNGERFIDRRDIPVAYNLNREPINPDTSAPAVPGEYMLQLDQAEREAWEDLAPKGALSMSPIDSDQLQFGRDYGLGDRVTVDIDGNPISDILREVRLSDSSSEGPRVAPLLGSSGATETPTLYRQVRRIWDSIKKLEARS